MKDIRPPKFVDNIYRDMRERRLLWPALALIVALIAVPIMLNDDASTSSATSSPITAGTDAASATAPAVVTEQLGITDYRERLNELKNKNPFHQQYVEPTRSAGLEATGGGSGSSTAGSTESMDIGAGSTSTATSETGETPVEGSSSSGSTSSSAGSQSSPPARSRGTKPGFHLYTYRVSVKVGEPGKLRERSQVSRLALLPNKKKPIVSFLGVSEGAEKALFLVSNNVDSVGGDGRCVPGRNSCQYVVMSPGDKVNLQYRPDNKRYNLILTGIHAVEIDDKPPAKVAGKAEPQAKLPELGPG